MDMSTCIHALLYMGLLSEHQSFFHMTEIIMSIVIHHVILYTETNIPNDIISCDCQFGVSVLGTLIEPLKGGT